MGFASSDALFCRATAGERWVCIARPGHTGQHHMISTRRYADLAYRSRLPDLTDRTEIEIWLSVP